MPASPQESRTLRGRLAAYTSWANTPDPAARTGPARQAFNQRFFDEVDPTRELPEEERVRRAGYARKAYFARLALMSARARRARAAGSGSTGA
jgi:hypothetical protein